MSHVLEASDFPLHGSRLIEASAGTGKTWTIAALYLRLVLGHGGTSAFQRPLTPPEILVMTFTRAATRELSDRIRSRLVEAVACFRGETPVQKGDDFLQTLIDAYPDEQAKQQAAWRLALAAECMDDAAIHTIDAWCQRMLREHAFDSGNLFDEELEPDEHQRQVEAFQDYWRQQIYPLDGPLLEVVLETWPHVDALIEDMGSLCREPVDQTGRAGTLGELVETIQRQSDEALKSLANGWGEKAHQLESWLDGQLETNKSAWNGQKLKPSNYKGWLQTLRSWADDPYPDLADQMKTGATRLLPAGLDDARKGDAPVSIPPESHALAELLEELSKLPNLSVALRMHAAAQVQKRLQFLKRQAGTFGFADMLERLDIALSGDNGAVLRSRVLNQYPVALIDEFQDTSPLQFRLFDQIYRTADNDPNSALLLIGDPKQSIYGFRGADIYSYLKARRATEGRHYVLGTNYRSTNELVQAVNRWFVQAESRPGSGAFMFQESIEGKTINPLPFESVAAKGRKERFVVAGTPVPAVTVNWHVDGEGGPSLGAALQNHMAQCCAEQIVQWLNDPTAGFAEESGKFERLRPRDIAILVRTGREAAAVRRQLQRRGVASVYLSDKESVFESEEAQDLLYLLRAVAAPLDSRAVRAGLATRLIGLELEELALLASDDEAFDAKSEIVRKLHSTWQRQGVLAMLRQTLHLLGLPARWLAVVGGERRLTNFLHLAELLQDASAALEGEQSVIRWLATQIETPGAGADEQVVRLESDADLVKVVTVHKSKGLEYPLVLLPFAADFRAAERRGTPFVRVPLANGDRELRLDYSDEELQAADRDRLREDLRLFYVALTRPRHLLWMGWGPLRKGQNKSCVNEKSASGYLLGGAPQTAPAQWREKFNALTSATTEIQCADAPAVVSNTMILPREAPLPLETRAPYQGEFERRWNIGSFSSLVRSAGAAQSAETQVPVLPMTVLRPADDEPQAALRDSSILLNAMAGPEASEPAWHRFLRGAVVGNFVHDQLEWLSAEDFALEESAQGPLAERLRNRCIRSGREDQADDLVEWLAAVVHHELPPLGVSLAQITSRLPEMEFWLPAERLPAEQLDALCRQYILPGRERASLAAKSLHGMLMGFADLVFEQDGRYWVLDYKSNHLGSNGAAYDAHSLANAMLEHRYDVQATIYLLALHKLLKSRLGPAYDPATQLGGAVYYFLRGIDGPAAGVHVEKANVEFLEAMENLLESRDALGDLA